MNQIKILEKLVSFDTINDKENNKIINYISNILEKKEFKIEIYNNKNNKKCLIAKSKEECELAFIGHSDTVSCSDNWITNPFELVINDSKLYGLGVSDMKGGIAAFLEALNNINLKKIKKGIMIIITFDEEIGFEGIKLLKNMKNIPNNIIVGEPTDNIVFASSKGCMEYEVTFRGKSVHSSDMILGDNAILKTINFIQDLKKITDSLKNETNTMFDTPFTTNNISIIEGGDCINKVPDKCKLLFDFRTVFETHNEIISSKLNDLIKKYNANLKELTNINPTNCSNINKIKVLENITNSKVSGANYVTEGNFFENRDTFIIGPGPVTAHQENEYIEIDSFNKTIDIYTKIIKYFCD